MADKCVRGFAAIFVTLSAFSGTPASAQTAQADSAPVVAESIKAIQESNTVAEAAKAFADGSNLNRHSLDLNRAYLSRVIQLGKPELAIYPAQNLIAAGAGDGVTYWAMGYYSGSRNDYRNALTWMMKAAATLKESNALVYQLGQLAGWCDGTHLALPDADAKALAKLKEELSAKPAYADGYKLIKESTDKLAAVEQLKKGIASTESEGRAEEQQAQAVKSYLDNLNSQLRATETRIRKLNDYLKHPGPDDDGTAATSLEDENGKRDELNAKIKAAEPELQKHADAATWQKAALEGFQAKLRTAPPANLDKSFRWSLPAGDTTPSSAPPTRPS